MTDDLDHTRFPFEARRAMYRYGVLPEMLKPGSLAMRSDGETITLIDESNGAVVGKFPVARLRRPDRRRLLEVLGEWPDPLGRLAQLAAIEGGVDDDPTDDYVSVRVDKTVLRVHRSQLVDGWGDEDDLEMRVSPKL